MNSLIYDHKELQDNFPLTQIFLRLIKQLQVNFTYHSKFDSRLDLKNKIENYKSFIEKSFEDNERLLEILNLEYKRILLLLNKANFTETTIKEVKHHKSNLDFFLSNTLKDNYLLKIDNSIIELIESSWYWPFNEPIIDYQKIICEQNLSLDKEIHYYCFHKVTFLEEFITITHNLTKSEFYLLHILKNQQKTYRELENEFLSLFDELSGSESESVKKSFELSTQKLISKNIIYSYFIHKV